ncbi:hypothetical protein OG497_39550 [Streptomyces sp. NBC_01242]|uniref:hypothetical protein n=1 Tax=Streptomyces sp. NBC_01242 TaxID=2903795 RepID=UPI00224CD10B|nr:hypothetical protein [Streptomyces sp. NBC_01242]MCX4799940.1 hypothetical protein [Streptomyces sp. NBC_01242]
MNQEQQIRAAAFAAAAAAIGPYIAARATTPEQAVDTVILELPELAREIAIQIRDGIPGPQAHADRKEDEWCGTCKKDRTLGSTGVLDMRITCEECPTVKV